MVSLILSILSYGSVRFSWHFFFESKLAPKKPKTNTCNEFLEDGSQVSPGLSDGSVCVCVCFFLGLRVGGFNEGCNSVCFLFCFVCFGRSDFGGKKKL